MDPRAATSPETGTGEPRGDVRTLATGASVSVAARVAGRGLYLVSQVVLARLLGTTAFGLYAIGWTLLRVGSLVAPVGLNHAVIRFAPRYREGDPAAFGRLLRRTIGVALGAGAALGLLLFLAAGPLAGRAFGKPELEGVLRLLAPAFALAAGLRVASAATQISRRMRYSAVAEELTQPGLNLLLIVALAGVLGHGLTGAVAAIALSYGVAFLLALHFVRRLFPEVGGPLPEVRRPWSGIRRRLAEAGTRLSGPARGRGAGRLAAGEIAGFAGQASLAGVFMMLVVWVDRLGMGVFRPAAEVGVYQAAALSATLFGIVLSGFNTIFSPMAADLLHRGEDERLRELFRVSTRWGVYVSLPLFLVVCFAGRDLLVGVFGTEYAPGATVLLILSAAQLLNAGTGAVGILLMMSGRQGRWLAIAAAMFATNLVLSVLLIPRFGMTGAAVAGAVGIGGLFSAGLWQVRRCLGLWPYDRRYLKGLAACLAAVGLLAVVPAPEAWPALARVSVTAALAAVAFFGGLALLGVEAEDRQLLAVLGGRLGLRGVRGAEG